MPPRKGTKRKVTKKSNENKTKKQKLFQLPQYLPRPTFVIIPYIGFTILKETIVSSDHDQPDEEELAAVTEESLKFPFTLTRSELHKALYKFGFNCDNDEKSYQELKKSLHSHCMTYMLNRE